MRSFQLKIGKQQEAKISEDNKKELQGIAADQNNGEFNNQIMIANEPLYLVQKEEMEQLLHRSIVAMKAPKKNSINTIYGSGVLLSRNIVLAATHNIYFKQFRQGIPKGYSVDKKNVKIYLQGNGLKGYEVEDWRYLQQFQTCSKQEEVRYDYVLIKLKDVPDLPKYDKFLQVGLPCQCIQQKDPSVKLNIYGYPIAEGEQKNYRPLDKQAKTVKLTQQGLTKENAIIQVQEETSTIKYTISTVIGQSGSPLVVDQKIIGIHKAGKISEQCNFGRLVTKDLISTILKWCQQFKGEPFKVDQSRQCSHINKNINMANKLTSKVGQTIEGTKWLQWLAEKYKNEQNYAMALLLYQKSLQINENIKRKESVQIAYTIHQIGRMYDYQLNYSKALECYIMALQMQERLKGKGCYESASTLNNMGLIYDNQHNYAKALECYHLALQIYERVKGKGFYESASTLYNMGLVYADQLNYSKALECFTLALQIQERVKGKGCYESASILSNMGSFYKNQSNYSKALECFTLALQIYERVKGKGCYESASTLSYMGSVYKNQLKYAKALEYYTLTLEIYEKVTMKGYQSAETLYRIGLVYTDQLKYSKALQCYKKSKSIYQNQNIKSKGYSNVLFNMGLLYYNKLKDYEAACKLVQSSLKIREQIDQNNIKKTALLLAKCLKVLNKKEKMLLITTKYGLKANQI